MMNEVYGIWDTERGGWLGHGGTIISGPEEVIQAVYRELIPEHEWFRADAQFVIAEFNAFGQPRSVEDGTGGCLASQTSQPREATSTVK